MRRGLPTDIGGGHGGAYAELDQLGVVLLYPQASAEIH